MRRLILALCLLLSALPAAAQPAHHGESQHDRRIAITIDDLPWQSMGAALANDWAPWHDKLIAQLKQADAPVTGFVNEQKLEVDGRVDPARLAMLQDWLEAGFDLGNHSYAHQSLHDIGVPAFQRSILDGERQLRPLLAARGKAPRWFRHPYLRNGTTPADKQAMDAFLARHGYKVAPVTVDNGEWVWAFAYRRVLDGSMQVPDREAALQRLRLGYVPYMLNKLDYYEAQSLALLGYKLPQVWLMHANELNADTFAELVAATRRRGYTTITLDEAMRDPAYQRPDGYVGKWGPSWVHRWAMAEKKPKDFYAGEPAVPQWVLAMAQVESE
jgi:peptidoglycan/xylan/chitin deacetylase (PgdA/CDA1 family)